MRIGETPVHIPNTMVKPYPAWDTAPATVWESRWLPDFFCQTMSDSYLIACIHVLSDDCRSGEILKVSQNDRTLKTAYERKGGSRERIARSDP